MKRFVSLPRATAKVVCLWLSATSIAAAGELDSDSDAAEDHGDSMGPGHGMTPMTSPLSDPAQCQGPMEVWDVGMAMCDPLPMAGMPMSMTMIHANGFGVWVSEEGKRGRRAFAAPNMVMIDAGTAVGDRHYLNIDLMATGELWTYPEAGYPELLQIGEKNSQGQPFIDAQHPHSSPIMGLTFSDTIRLSQGKDHLKLFFAPRGESTDGPVAFMHRPTGMVNPDAPLGHHVGQDVGHISSTVIGASLKLAETRFEVSTFYGREPEPTKVDLPIGKPDSWAARVIEEFSPRFLIMASGAYLHEPEPDQANLKFRTRYSASAYNTVSLQNGWTFYNTLIYGAIHNLDNTSWLSSYGEEFLWRGSRENLWGRLEVLQRTAAELAIPQITNPNHGSWVMAATCGYTQVLGQNQGLEWGLGGSVTRDFLPAAWQSTYGPAKKGELTSLSGSPWSAKIFVQLSGMKMTAL